MSKPTVSSQAELEKLYALYNSGKYLELEKQARKVLAKFPGLGFGWQLLGASLTMQGKDALSAFQRSAFLLPNEPGAYSNLGLALLEHSRFKEAVASFQRAIKSQPDFADAHFNLGNAYRATKQFPDAAESYRRSTELKPGFANAHYFLGSVLKEMGQYAEAANCFQRALELKPQVAEVHFYLGVVLQMSGNLTEAVTSYRSSLQINPELDDAHSNLGACLKDLGQIDASMECFRQALIINPGNALAHNNLGLAFKEAGRLDEAIDCYRQAVSLDPNYTQAYSNLLYLLTFHPSFDETLILSEVKQFASSIKRNDCSPVISKANLESRFGRRLRIGYVSPDFRDHCQSLFTLPLLSNHDHTRFEVYCYADLAQPDEITNCLTAFADVWRSTRLKGDEQVAEMIANDGIDVLGDLTMHMAYGRPLLFARKPAPIQIAWLVYPGTTGVPQMDYRLTDPWLDPAELDDARYTETSIRLNAWT